MPFRSWLRRALEMNAQTSRFQTCIRRRLPDLAGLWSGSPGGELAVVNVYEKLDYDIIYPFGTNRPTCQLWQIAPARSLLDPVNAAA